MFMKKEGVCLILMSIWLNVWLGKDVWENEKSCWNVFNGSVSGYSILIELFLWI